MRKVSTIGMVTVLVALLSFLQEARADVIVWDNVPFSPNGSLGITVAAVANDFTFGTSTSFDHLRFWASSDLLGDQTLSNFHGTIGWAIHTDSGGVPGVILLSGFSSSVALINTGVNTFYNGARIFQLDFSLGTISLPAGTYWLQLREGLIGSPSDGTPIAWTDSAGPLLGVGQRFDVNVTNPTFPDVVPVDSAFQLITTVPVFSCVGFKPPMNAGPVTVKKNRVLPLKAQLLDSDGNAVTEIPGPYRFFFYSFDCHEPPHVHVRRERMVCKF